MVVALGTQLIDMDSATSASDGVIDFNNLAASTAGSSFAYSAVLRGFEQQHQGVKPEYNQIFKQGAIDVTWHSSTGGAIAVHLDSV